MGPALLCKVPLQGKELLTRITWQLPEILAGNCRRAVSRTWPPWLHELLQETAVALITNYCDLSAVIQAQLWF